MTWSVSGAVMFEMDVDQPEAKMMRVFDTSACARPDFQGCASSGLRVGLRCTPSFGNR